MQTLITMAWRNLWRNKRRTLITLSSVFLAVFLALIMRAWQLGTYRKMVHDVVRSYSGYIQIHGRGYWENKTLEYSFQQSDTLTGLLKMTRGVAALIPRLESFALASGSEQTKGVMVVGIDAQSEQKLTEMASRVYAGDYLAENDLGVLVAEKLAAFLNVTVGDTLILLSQGYQGISAAGKYPIHGLVHFASPQLNSQLVFMSLPLCQDFFGAENRITSLALDLDNSQLTAKITAVLQQHLLKSDYEVMPWDKMQVELVQQIESDNASGLIMLGILYMIVTFGIFGTLMMMISERRREFGVMLAIGMRKQRILAMLSIETLIMSFIAVVLGCFASMPLIYYYAIHPPRLSGELAKAIENFGIEPVLPFLFEPSIFIHQAWTVLIISILAAAYPLYSILKLSTVKALHQ